MTCRHENELGNCGLCERDQAFETVAVLRDRISVLEALKAKKDERIARLEAENRRLLERLDVVQKRAFERGFRLAVEMAKKLAVDYAADEPRPFQTFASEMAEEMDRLQPPTENRLADSAGAEKRIEYLKGAAEAFHTAALMCDDEVSADRLKRLHAQSMDDLDAALSTPPEGKPNTNDAGSGGG